MANVYACLYDSYLPLFEKFTLEEAGRMVRGILEYHAQGKEPDFADDPVIDASWVLVKMQLDANGVNYDNKVKAGKKGGLARADNLSSRENSATNVSSSASDVCSRENSATNESQAENAVLDNENENENEKEKRESPPPSAESGAECTDGADEGSLSPLLPTQLSPPQQKLSHAMFEKWQQAKLPVRCGEIGFSQDFYNALSELRRQKVKSNDVIKAVENYVEVLNDERCYYKQRLTILDFAKQNTLQKFLPGNYVKNNFLRYDIINAERKKAGKTKAPPPPIAHPDRCEECNVSLVQSVGGMSWFCPICNATWTAKGKLQRGLGSNAKGGEDGDGGG